MKLTSIRMCYGDRIILRNISLEIAPYSITLLTGANGAGKSTLLRIMAGLIKSESGKVEMTFEGTQPIGYVGHTPFLYAGMTAIENLTFWSRLYGIKATQADLFTVLKRVNLARYAEERAGGFSRGMAQRLDLARVLLLNSSLLLLDEPGTGLDQDSLKMLHKEIALAKERGAGIVWISHDLQTDALQADRLIILADRQLSQDIKTADYLVEQGIQVNCNNLVHCEEKKVYLKNEVKSPNLAHASLSIACKDLKLILARGAGLVQGLLLGLLLVFVFSLSQKAGDRMSAQGAATIFWLSSAFCQVLVFNMLYGLEEHTLAGLLLMPAPIQAVWIGKASAGLILILLAQIVFLPATIVFLDQTLDNSWTIAVLAIILVDFGLAILGSLLGALSQGQAARESLLSVILFPLIIPLLLAGIHTCTMALLETFQESNQAWMNLALAFDAVFLATGLILFPFVFARES